MMSAELKSHYDWADLKNRTSMPTGVYKDSAKRDKVVESAKTKMTEMETMRQDFEEYKAASEARWALLDMRQFVVDIGVDMLTSVSKRFEKLSTTHLLVATAKYCSAQPGNEFSNKTPQQMRIKMTKEVYKIAKNQSPLSTGEYNKLAKYLREELVFAAGNESDTFKSLRRLHNNMVVAKKPGNLEVHEEYTWAGIEQVIQQKIPAGEMWRSIVAKLKMRNKKLNNLREDEDEEEEEEEGEVGA